MQNFPDGSTEASGPGPLRTVVAQWFPGGADVAPLVSGGFSGSPVFLIRPAADTPHVLKAFAPGTSRPRAEWVHGIVRRLRDSGASEIIPGLRTAANGSTLVATDDSRLWEMTEFIDGVAASTPTCAQIASTMRALARVHSASARLAEEPPTRSVSRGWTERVKRSRTLAERPWRSLLETATPSTEFTRAIAAEVLVACEQFDAGSGPQLLTWLTAFAAPALPCQVVLRDVWSEHVLFARHAPDQVAGIIDLHATGIDTPAADIARVLGSWMPLTAPVSTAWWASALAAYESVRPLGASEQRLVPILAATGVVFGLDNWFQWTLLEGRRFPDDARVVSRVRRLAASLPAALNVMREISSHAGLTVENSSP